MGISVCSHVAPCADVYVQEQLTALSQKQLDMASFPEQVVHHIEQDLAEVMSRLDRQAPATICIDDKCML